MACRVENHVVAVGPVDEVLARVVDDVLSAHGSYQFHLRRAAHARDLGTERLGDLQGEPAHAAGRPDDQHVLFSADNSSNLLALDPATGKTLWHLNAGGRMVASPMTYQLDGKQYLLFAVQDLLYAFALPEGAAKP